MVDRSVSTHRRTGAPNWYIFYVKSPAARSSSSDGSSATTDDAGSGPSTASDTGGYVRGSCVRCNRSWRLSVCCGMALFGVLERVEQLDQVSIGDGRSRCVDRLDSVLRESHVGLALRLFILIVPGHQSFVGPLQVDVVVDESAA